MEAEMRVFRTTILKSNIVDRRLGAVALASLAALMITPLVAQGADPIRLHPENPRYFLFRGKPAILIASGEHYAAVLNLDFDYKRYLDELQAKGLNLTRTFAGTYRETTATPVIPDNTLAPAPARFAAPWPRTSTPGAVDGINKFDLTKWNGDFFRRLKDFVGEADKRGIVVEFVLFCVLYNDELWNVNPMNAKNNVNGIGNVPKEEVLTLRHPGLNRVQTEFVRKVVTELRDFDNLYYEVVNEPYIPRVYVAQDFHDLVIQTIVETEANFPKKHLIAQNYSNGFQRVCRPNPAISILNFHYASPPVTVLMNYDLMKPVALDEDGFEGTTDFPYRANAWEFLLAGGAVYSNVDFSFTQDHPDGTYVVPQGLTHGGSPSSRTQMGILRKFIEGFNFLRMVPDTSFIKGGARRGEQLTYTWKQSGFYSWRLQEETPEARVWALAEKGKAYALYLRGAYTSSITLELPAGSYRAEWVNTKTGTIERSATFSHRGGDITLATPAYFEDIALRLQVSQ
jgi:hypothetical protein